MGYWARDETKETATVYGRGTRTVVSMYRLVFRFAPYSSRKEVNDMRLSPQLMESLKRQEGFRTVPSLCATGHVTIGYGHNLEADPSPLWALDEASGLDGVFLAQQIRQLSIKGNELFSILSMSGLRWNEVEATGQLERDALGMAEVLSRRCPAYRHLTNLAAAARAGRSEGMAPNADADRACARAEVLINMAFNMGVAALLKFRRVLDAVRADTYAAAATHMLDSRWASQVGRRAVELARQMKTGERS